MNKISVKKTFRRSVYKTITWRILASIDTAALTWWFSGDIIIGLKVGGMEIVTKVIIYFLHERAWRIVGKNKLISSIILREGVYIKQLHIETIGTIDTFILAWFFTKSAATGGYVAIAEVFTKIIIYYLHERVWDRQRFGINYSFVALGSNIGSRKKNLIKP